MQGVRYKGAPLQSMKVETHEAITVSFTGLGASIHPRRTPGPKIFEKVPTDTTLPL